MKSIMYAFRVSCPVISRTIRQTCEAIWEVLHPVVIPELGEDDWKIKSEEFEDLWQFPNCVGAVDGKHVSIQAPKQSGSLYFNYKGSFSIVLLAVSDAKYNFTVVDIGAPGMQSDGGTFLNSQFGKRMNAGSLHLPEDSRLTNSTVVCPYVFVADAAFPLKECMMRPYPGRGLTLQRKIFNYRLSRARRCIENAFGIMASRFRIFRKPIIASLETTEAIIKACVCLHNYIKNFDCLSKERYCPKNYADYFDEDGELREGYWRNDFNNGLSDVTRMASNMYSQSSSSIRESFARYFQYEGAVPWQMKQINFTGAEM